jgi:hypothetical protein
MSHDEGRPARRPQPVTPTSPSIGHTGDIIDRSTVSEWLEGKRKAAEIFQPPESRQHFDIWQFGSDGGDIIDLQAARAARHARLTAWVRRGAQLAITTSVPCTGVCTCWGTPLGGEDR